MAIKAEENKPGDLMRVVTLERPASDRSVYNLALDVLLKRSSGKNRRPPWSLVGVVMASGKAFQFWQFCDAERSNRRDLPYPL